MSFSNWKKVDLAIFMMLMRPLNTINEFWAEFGYDPCYCLWIIDEWGALVRDSFNFCPNATVVNPFGVEVLISYNILEKIFLTITNPSDLWLVLLLMKILKLNGIERNGTNRNEAKRNGQKSKKSWKRAPALIASMHCVPVQAACTLQSTSFSLVT